ncbi:lytic transglycosylase domain-containing protein [Streptomyces sp. TRM76323]|uniref:Lytic transglycosylase domain-containing protein n=1 Tax=Streptomyces tamarix TaxID=3078565 RepID=A0ABU3QFA1_9ACTN|nr:lytic transglycosylase domain-containing protein [Streptomyces tamarix]MDT9681450.1 lytic transglycosylase domain-containing protein [Streptomyces tamarix]
MAVHIRRRLRKSATTTAVAAAAVAALSASQAPGATPATTGGQPAGDTTPPASSGSTATGDSPYYTDLPPLNSPNPVGPADGGPVGTGPAEAGIPATVLAAYKQAEQYLKTARPGCNLPWQLLAGIGKVESGQARGGRVNAAGTTFSPILGPVLNGNGFADISDTDDGAYDGDTRHDRAVGPMQFIPSTWASWGQDANGDGRKDPNNIYDAAQAAGMYLCANNRDLAVKADLDRAILSYNQSREYLRTVLSWFEFYKRGTHQVPDGTGVQPVERSDSRTPGGSTYTPTPTPTPAPAKTPSPSATTPTPGATPGTQAPKPGTTTPPAKPAPVETVPTRPSPSPTPPKPVPTPTPTPTPAPADRVSRLADAGTGALTAPAGTEFAERPSVVARDARGGLLALVPVRFEIAGDTDARFANGATAVTVTTGSDGTATAPALRAGEKTGRFTVRATVPKRPAVTPVAFAATVTAGRADTLTPTGGAPLTAAPEGEFAQRLTVRATRGGAAVPGTELTAAMVTEGPGGTHTPSDGGPYFKDAQGAPIRTLTGLTTDADGVLQLPPMYADGRTGTFLLRLTAQGGASLTVELTVTAA